MFDELPVSLLCFKTCKVPMLLWNIDAKENWSDWRESENVRRGGEELCKKYKVEELTMPGSIVSCFCELMFHTDWKCPLHFWYFMT